jgi:hypothetical protein
MPTTSFGCHCPERQAPIEERRWRVVQRHTNNYRKPSEYSRVVCLECGKSGRTRARYVDQIPDLQVDWTADLEEE